MNLKDNKILITGATSGIGYAMTHKFLELNNEVIAVGRNKEALEKIQQQFSNVHTFYCDLSRSESLNDLVSYISTHHANLNILINNAGIQYNYSFFEDSRAYTKAEHEIRVNLLAPLELIAGLSPIIQKNTNSAIVNISSGLGLVPKMSAPVYCGTKAAIHIFSQALRHQAAVFGLKIFEIIPSLVDTPMTLGRGKDKISPEQLVDEFIRAFKQNRYEVNIGKIKLLTFINRISPGLAQSIMKGG